MLLRGVAPMGKHSNFKRRKLDIYDTPGAAVLPLFKHLPSHCRFWEPCAGQGDLVEHLQRGGFECVVASDIEPRDERVFRLDAMSATREDLDTTGASHIITNPVWSRPLLHAMIEHFSLMRPTWLLFDADWVHTTQDVVARKYGVKTVPELMKHCRKIVSVGRVRWIEGSKYSGKENCAWHLFDQSSSSPVEFFGRAA